MSTELRRELGEDMDVIAELSADESEELLGMLEDAKAGQRAQLTASIDEALDHLPWLVRKPARKILFG